MKTANLSAILANYNHASFLPRAINAIVRQSVRPKELIIVDDCSTDGSIAVIQEFAAREPIIRLVQNPRNLGVCESVTGAIPLASGEYLLFAAADDYLLPGMIEKSLDQLGHHPMAGMSCGFGSTIDEVTGELCPNVTGWCDQPSYLSPADLAVRIGAGFVPSTSAIYRRAAVERVGGYLPDLRWHCDWFMNLAIGFRDGICHIPETLALITVRPTTYGAQGMKDQVAMREVVLALLQRLNSPAYCDLVPLFQLSGVMGNYLSHLLHIAAYLPNEWSTVASLPQSDLQLRALAALFLAPLCDHALRLKETSVNQLQEQLTCSQRKTAEAQALIAGMRSSTFWKIRDVAVRCKQSIPLFRRRTA
jgi:glycosyltransferase involved in cell wall biosynthesis